MPENEDAGPEFDPKEPAIYRREDGTFVARLDHVARHHGKSHHHVMDAARKLLEYLPHLQGANFRALRIRQEKANGGWREVETYEVDRKGFSMLVMGFTGKQAAEWKDKYTDAFELMAAGNQGRMSEVRERFERLEAQLASLAELVTAERQEAVRLLKGATWGMTKNQTKHVDGHFDNLNNGIRSVDARVGDVQEELNETRMWTVSRLLKELKVQAGTGFARRFSNQLRTYCLDHNLRFDRDPNNRALYRYDIEAAKEWLIKGGQVMVDVFMAERKAEDKARRKVAADAEAGQGGLGLPNVVSIKKLTP